MFNIHSINLSPARGVKARLRPKARLRNFEFDPGIELGDKRLTGSRRLGLGSGLGLDKLA